MKKFALRVPLCLLAFQLLGFPALAWDPDDDTFDPTIPSVVAEGASRIGDPSPFLRDGHDEIGFTHVMLQDDPVRQKKVVSISLIHPGDTAGGVGGFLFLEKEQAENLAKALRSRAGQINSGEESDQPILELPGMSGHGDWNIFVEGKVIVFRRQSEDEVDVFRFRPNPARKFAGAIEHNISLLEESE